MLLPLCLTLHAPCPIKNAPPCSQLADLTSQLGKQARRFSGGEHHRAEKCPRGNGDAPNAFLPSCAGLSSNGTRPVCAVCVERNPHPASLCARERTWDSQHPTMVAISEWVVRKTHTQEHVQQLHGKLLHCCFVVVASRSRITAWRQCSPSTVMMFLSPVTLTSASTDNSAGGA